jgi:hypothetical protein
MKINYSTTWRIRRDQVRIVINVEEDAKPIFMRGVKYQPTSILVDYDREVRRSSDGHDLDANEWSEEYSVKSRRVLKSGALGQQVTNLFYSYNVENQHPWIQTALQFAHEEFLKIIKDWPDPEWPEESLPVL